MKEKKVYANIAEIVISLLESGVDIQIIKNALVRGGFTVEQVNELIGLIGETKSNELINLAYQYLNSMKEDLNSVVNLLSKTK